MKTLKLTILMILSVVIISGRDTQAQATKTLPKFLENYFLLKDALVASDGKQAQVEATNMFNLSTKIDMKNMSTEQHSVWMKNMKSINEALMNISKSNNIEKQRKSFMQLSTLLVDLAKLSDNSATVYLQRCPMYNNGKGATWLSKESAIKNPYYGSQMLSCGKTIETIK